MPVSALFIDGTLNRWVLTVDLQHVKAGFGFVPYGASGPRKPTVAKQPSIQQLSVDEGKGSRTGKGSDAPARMSQKRQFLEPR